MAQFIDDDELADNWEDALEQVEQEDEEAKRAEEKRKKEKEEKEQRTRALKRQTADQQEDVADVTSGAGAMLAEAMGRETAGDFLTSEHKEVAFFEQTPTTDAEMQEFGLRLATAMAAYKDRNSFPVAMAALAKAVGNALNTDDLNALLSKVALLQAKRDSHKPTAAAAASGPAAVRGARNTDVDAFAAVTDRGGAHVTEEQDFM